MEKSSTKQIVFEAEICEDRYIAVTVSDTGRGMPSEISEQVGATYLPGHTGESGLGLGLLVAQAIIEACGGYIQVEFYW